MAKIRDAKPKNSSGGYERLVGNQKLADLLQKAQSTIITNGTELEKIIQNMTTTLIDDLDEFIDKCKHKQSINGVYLCTKKVAKKSKYGLKNKEPDFILFCLSANEDICYIIELKDGHVFDTKKAQGEKENIDEYVKSIASEIPFQTKGYICCFNMLDKQQIIHGLKGKFSEDEVMTGKELCDILDIDYDDIINKRKADTKDNFEFFVNEICSLIEVKNNILQRIRKHIISEEFYEYDDEEE